jgi:hypothetical protein
MKNDYETNIVSAIKETHGTKRALCKKHNWPYDNYQRRLLWYIKKVNEWLKPLGLKVELSKLK